MTDRSDDFRERLPETDRIRDRIREQREAGDDRFADANDSEDYIRYELKNFKSGAPDSVPESIAVHEAELKKVVGEDSKLDPVESKFGEGAFVDDITLAPEQKITDAATVKGAGDLKADGSENVVDYKADDLKGGQGLLVGDHAGHVKADGLKGVVDPRADDLQVAEGVDDLGFFEKPTWENVTDRSGDMKVVDPKADDLTSDVKVTVDGVIGESGAPEVAISADADWEVPLTSADEIDTAAEPPVDNLEIEQTANLSGGDDPVGDALDPLGDGGDALVGLPDVELSDDGASGFADDIDLSDGI